MTDSAKVLQMVLGAIFVAFLGFQAWLAVQVNTINDRLTKLETTIGENKSERQAQVADLRERVGRLEVRVYREREE